MYILHTCSTGQKLIKTSTYIKVMFGLHMFQDLVESWKQDGCAIEYRPSQERDDGTVEKLLLCLQTPWQKRLLVLYGQQMCLLDATYRTSK